MQSSPLMRSLIALVVACLAGAGATAEMLSATATTEVQLAVTRGGSPGESVDDAATFPDSDSTLPLQVVARLVDPNVDAAAVVAAQFADPNTAATEDPDSFAVNLALNSLVADLAYTGTGYSEEVRTIAFQPAEFPGTSAGDTVAARGRIFLDGALAIFAPTDVTDLTGTSVRLVMTVTQEFDSGDSIEVFTATLEIAGGTDRTVTATTAGDFPRAFVFRTDLAGVDDNLGVFDAFVFPGFQRDYNFSATVGEPFKLRARVTVTASQSGKVGAVALVGTPLSTVNEIIAATQGDEAAAKMTTALTREIADPTGEPAFAEGRLQNVSPLLPACGLLGLELVAGLVGLTAIRATWSRRAA